jgi:cytochrome c
MKKRNIILVTSLVIFAATIMGTRLGTQRADTGAWDPSTPVADVLSALGVENPDHRPADLSPETIKKGKEIIFMGYTTGPDGKRSRIQSRYFQCTSCHLTEKEDPDLRVSDPDARLKFVLSKGMPFLQGTTLYGTSNKVSWYNGDYERKYGDWIKPARHSLKGAIDLCSTVCSQGRSLDEWEMNAVLAYFWSISLKLGDLDLSKADWQRLAEVQKTGQKDAATADWLRSYYRQGSPATFLEAPENKKEGYADVQKGNPKVGKDLYVNACMSCHGAQGSSKYLKIDTGDLSLGMFRRNFQSDGYLSIYEIIRHGTHAVTGHRPYMPNYTAERMSNQQVEDLRAFIEQGAASY